MNQRFVLSQAADDDLLEIWAYVFHFEQSDRRADATLDALYDTFRYLAEYPQSGTPRLRLGPGILAFSKHGYVIAYRVTESAIEIARVSGGEEDILDDL